MIPKQDLISALESIPWFQGISKEHFDKLASISDVIEIEAGKDLFHQGDKQDYLYVIVKGRVAIEIAVPGKGRMRISTAEPTEMLGWSSVTPVVRQRTASAVTVLPSVLIRMKANELQNLCEKNHSFGYVIMRRIANVAASRLLVTRLQLLDMFSPSDKEGSNA
ncbi:MAG: Crp/Fnr family transcriptional regulator [Chloroflexi bacterium]|nr:Crp/Fnr family transcriptional regulator [Chloroflexota bacterium]